MLEDGSTDASASSLMSRSNEAERASGAIARVIQIKLRYRAPNALMTKWTQNTVSGGVVS